LTEHGDDDDGAYRRFLDEQSLPTLRDWALKVARERLDAGFLYELVKHLPDNYDVNRDWAVLDPFDAVGQMAHLVTHFREEAADPKVAPMLRAAYIDYLAEHAGTHRFDRDQAARGTARERSDAPAPEDS
jgi:hypothetical protein